MPSEHDPIPFLREPDPIAFLRFVLRSGDVALAERVASALRSDPRYRARAEHALAALGSSPEAMRHSSPGGRILDSLLDRFSTSGQN
jgi:hypothetical protein